MVGVAKAVVSWGCLLEGTASPRTCVFSEAEHCRISLQRGCWSAHGDMEFSAFGFPFRESQ